MLLLIRVFLIGCLYMLAAHAEVELETMKYVEMKPVVKETPPAVIINRKELAGKIIRRLRWLLHIADDVARLYRSVLIVEAPVRIDPWTIVPDVTVPGTYVQRIKVTGNRHGRLGVSGLASMGVAKIGRLGKGALASRGLGRQVASEWLVFARPRMAW